jgi:transposase
MPNKRLSMRKIKEALRLQANGMSNRQIAQTLHLSRPTIANYLRRAAKAGLGWPLPPQLTDAALEQRLFPPPPTAKARDLTSPDWQQVHRELKRKGVTQFLLWQEYLEQHPRGYQYSWFCDLYRAWRGKLDIVMRQDHRAGEKLFVDYAGHTVSIVNQHTGELREAQIFIAVLGASNYTYAEATWTQSLPDWIGSHQRTFSFLGGSTRPASMIPISTPPTRIWLSIMAWR